MQSDLVYEVSYVVYLPKTGVTSPALKKRVDGLKLSHVLRRREDQPPLQYALLRNSRTISQEFNEVHIP